MRSGRDHLWSRPLPRLRIPFALLLALPGGCWDTDRAHSPATAERVAGKAGPAAQRAEGRTPSDQPQRSQPSLTLVGTVVLDDPARSTATIRIGASGSLRAFRPGDQIAPGIALVSVEARRVLLVNGVRLETLALLTGGDPQTALPPRYSKEAAEAARDLLYAGAPVTSLALDAASVRRALRDRHALAQQLESSELHVADDYENERFVRVTQVPPGSLYDQMRLAPGDVLVMVDDAFLLNTGDRLFDALQRGSRTTLRILREGTPSTIEYELR
jgi:type II secretory pathway component PulC